MELTDGRLNKVIGCRTYHQRVPQYGDRAWAASGPHLDVVYWDVGNGWCQVLRVVSKRQSESDVEGFLEKIRENDGGQT